MRAILFYILSISMPILMYGQGFTSVLKGNVIDKDSRQPLYGVNVTVTSVTPVTGTTTDERGLSSSRTFPPAASISK
jgi:hypothetical protein